MTTSHHSGSMVPHERSLETLLPFECRLHGVSPIKYKLLILIGRIEILEDLR